MNLTCYTIQKIWQSLYHLRARTLLIGQTRVGSTSQVWPSILRKQIKRQPLRAAYRERPKRHRARACVASRCSEDAWRTEFQRYELLRDARRPPAPLLSKQVMLKFVLIGLAFFHNLKASELYLSNTSTYTLSWRTKADARCTRVLGDSQSPLCQPLPTLPTPTKRTTPSKLVANIRTALGWIISIFLSQETD